MITEQYSCSKTVVKPGNPKIILLNKTDVKAYHWKTKCIRAKEVQTMAKMSCKSILHKTLYSLKKKRMLQSPHN